MATQVYYSVCPFGTGSLLSGGSPTIVVDSSGNATLTLGGATQATNIGQGVCVEYNSRVSYIDSITDATHFHLVTALGANAAEQGSTACTSIHHVWASLNAGEAAADDAAFINNASLTAADVVLNLCCYYDHDDSTADTELLTIDGYTTDSTRYIKVYTPRGLGSNESINNQRHAGKWDLAKYRISLPGRHDVAITIRTEYTRIEGLQIECTSSGTAGSEAGIFIEDTGCRISKNIVRRTGTTSGKGIRWEYMPTASSIYIWNNLVYGVWQHSLYCDQRYTTVTVSGAIYNNTLPDLGDYVRYNTGNASGLAYINNIYGSTTLVNVGTVSDSVASADVTFTDSDNDDYSLASDDTEALDQGADLSANAILAFSDDIIGTTRSTWDIGAFEYVAGPKWNTITPAKWDGINWGNLKWNGM